MSAQGYGVMMPYVFNRGIQTSISLDQIMADRLLIHTKVGIHDRNAMQNDSEHMRHKPSRYFDLEVRHLQAGSKIRDARIYEEIAIQD